MATFSAKKKGIQGGAFFLCQIQREGGFEGNVPARSFSARSWSGGFSVLPLWPTFFFENGDKKDRRAFAHCDRSTVRFSVFGFCVQSDKPDLLIGNGSYNAKCYCINKKHECRHTDNENSYDDFNNKLVIFPQIPLTYNPYDKNQSNDDDKRNNVAKSNCFQLYRLSGNSGLLLDFRIQIIP